MLIRESMYRKKIFPNILDVNPFKLEMSSTWTTKIEALKYGTQFQCITVENKERIEQDLAVLLTSNWGGRMSGSWWVGWCWKYKFFYWLDNNVWGTCRSMLYFHYQFLLAEAKEIIEGTIMQVLSDKIWFDSMLYYCIHTQKIRVMGKRNI